MAERLTCCCGTWAVEPIVLNGRAMLRLYRYRPRFRDWVSWGEPWNDPDALVAYLAKQGTALQLPAQEIGG
jgi:hypothetical protein